MSILAAKEHALANSPLLPRVPRADWYFPGPGVVDLGMYDPRALAGVVGLELGTCGLAAVGREEIGLGDRFGFGVAFVDDEGAPPAADAVAGLAAAPYPLDRTF